MNFKREILNLNGRRVSIDQVKDLQKKAAGDKLVEMKLTKTIAAAAENKLREFKLILSGDFKKYLQSNSKPVKSIVDLDISILDGIDEFTPEEAAELGIADGLGKLAHKDIYKTINDRIFALIKEGNLSWRKGWRDGVKIKGKTYGAQNYVSQSPYRGFNAFSIALFNMANNSNYTYFLTLKQIKERGGDLIKGAEGIYVAAFIRSEKTKQHPTNPDLVNVEIKQGIIPYIVYPLEQTKGVKPIKRKDIKAGDSTDIEDIIVKPQTVIDQMPKAPPIKHGGDRAYYTPAGDFVQMPLKKSFHTLNEYYSTLFHELVHSTGSSKRLDRKFKPTTKFGDKDYAFEELIAELGASYLCGVTGIEYFTLKNSAAYLESWSRRLSIEMKSDKTFFFRAIMGATKAAKYIIGETVIDTHVGGKGKKKSVSPKKTAAVKPNKSQKATFKASISDVSKIKKYEGIPESYINLFHAKFKSGKPVAEDSLSSVHLAMFSKLGESYKLITYKDEGSEREFVPTSLGEDLLKAIEGRLHTLKAKRQGNDLFPDLAGSNEMDPAWFPKYKEFKHKPKEAIKHLLKERKGDCIAALSRQDIGDIDIPWGENDPKTNVGFGLKHIVEKHGKEIERLGFKVEDFIPIVVQFGEFNLQKSDKKKKVYENKYFRFVVSVDLNGNNKNWLLTAFDLTRKINKNALGTIKTIDPNGFTLGSLLQKTNASTKLQKTSQKARKHLVDGKRYSDQELIEKANADFYYEIQDAFDGEEITTVAEAKKMYKAYGENVKPVKRKSGLSGIMSVSEAANGQFDLLGLDGAYEKMIGEACRPTSFFIYGPGGSGKSTFTLQFAYYLAQKGNKVAYVAGEQFATPVFSKMLKRLSITDLDTFVIAKDLNSIDPKQYQVIVIDSKDSLGIDHLQFEKLQKSYPALSWAILSQATKDGGFTGSEKWRNLVDTMIYCESGIAQTGIDKNRWGGKWDIKVY